MTYIPKETNDGPQRARTIGIERSSGEFVQLLDDDDRLLDGKLHRQVELLDRDDDVGVVYCGYEWDDGTIVLPKKYVKGNVLEEALMFDTAPCVTSTMLVRHSVIEQCLPLTDRSGADDTGLKIELAQRTEFDYVDEALVFRNHSPNSRQESVGKVDAQKALIDDYTELYERFPSTVYRTALGETYLISGLERLDDRLWSPSTVVELTKACYYMPGLPLRLSARLRRRCSADRAAMSDYESCRPFADPAVGARVSSFRRRRPI